MPIKPENRNRYPANWPEIRARILARAGNRCEQCFVANGDTIVRGIDKDAGTFQRFEGDGEVYAADDGRLLGYCKASEYCGCKWTKVVLTIAHLGLPAHLPVHLHVTRSTETDEIFQVVGLFMPLDAKAPEWHAMMHRRALTEFLRGSPAVGAGFFVALPRGVSGLSPRSAVLHEPLSVAPEAILLTDWRLFGEPCKAAYVAAEATPSVKVKATDIESLAASLTSGFSEAALASAHGFVAAGRRASLSSVCRLLGGNRKSHAADNAVNLSWTSSWSSSDAGALGSAITTVDEIASANSGTCLSSGSWNVRKQNSACSAIDMRGTFSWSGHAKLYHADQYPENCDDDNLRAWCQRCHLAYDAEHHRANASATRRARKAIGDLFDGAIA